MGLSNAWKVGASRCLALAFFGLVASACGGDSGPSTVAAATPSTMVVVSDATPSSTADATTTSPLTTSAPSTSTTTTSTPVTSAPSTSTTTTKTPKPTAPPATKAPPPPEPPTTTTTTTSTTVAVTSTLAPTTTDVSVAPGSTLYAGNCGVCHGWAGEGGVGADLQSSTLGLGEIIDVVTNGRNEMPSWMGILTPAEIEAVSAYVKSLQGG